MRRRRDRHDSSPEINLTPMIDMVFILLIFFLVASSFVKEAGIEVNRPVAQTAQTQGRGTIRIALSETGEIWMERRSIDVRAVRANVERMLAESPEASVVVLADETAYTGLLVQVMDQVRLAGVTDIAVAARQQEG
ncbi:MAG: biopolymer transporter ExbD [Desulfurellaceae bacterium]|nr:biopolymer transporter ExbD [Desulfurellaceae bacterium]